MTSFTGQQSWFPVAVRPARAASPARLMATVYGVAALLIILLLALHSFHFRDRDYRVDEIITAHASTFRSPSDVVQWMAFDIHPPLWRVGATMWAAAFGQDEQITRFFSTLLSALTLALVYRLAADLFGWRAGLLAVFVLGTLGHYQFYSHEFRPYPALMLFTAASQLALLRWIRQPSPAHALAVVFTSLGVIYTHYFGLFVVAAQIALYLVLVRWNRANLLRALGLLVAVGIGYLPWLFVLLHTVLIQRPGGVTYAHQDTWRALVNAHDELQIRPVGLGMFILLIALLAPIVPRRVQLPKKSPFRFGSGWPKWYLAFFVALIVVGVAIANDQRAILTRRNLSIIVPSLAVMAGFGLLVLPARLRAPAMAMILIPALFDFRSLEPNAPYRAMLGAVQPAFSAGDKLIMSEPYDFQRDALRDYLTDRLPSADPDQDIWNVPQNPHADWESPTVPPDASAQREALIDFLGNARRVFYFEAFQPSVLGLYTLQVLANDYALTNHHRFGSQDDPWDYQILEFTRIPEPRVNLDFGGQLTLAGWQLQTDVEAQPCDWIPVHTFWTAQRVPDDNYSLSLVLADSTGVGIARSDREPAGVLTLQWQPGRVYFDDRSVQVPCDASPGEYPLLVTLYDYETLAALPVTRPDGGPIGSIAYLTTIHVR